MSLRVCLLLFIPIVAGSTPDYPNWTDSHGPLEGVDDIEHGDLELGWFELPGNRFFVQNKSLTIGMNLFSPLPNMGAGDVNATFSYFMFFGTEFCQQQYVEARHWNDDPYQDWSFLHGCYDGSLNGTEVNGEFDVAQGRVAWQVPTAWIGSGCEVTILQPYGLATTQVLGDLQETPFDDRGPNSGFGENETFGSCYSGPGSCPHWSVSASSCVSYESEGHFRDVNFTIRKECCTVWNFTGTNLTLDYHANFTWPWTLHLRNRTEFFDLEIEADTPGTINIGWGAGPVMVSVDPRWGHVDVDMRFYEPHETDEQQAPWLTLPYVLLGLALLIRRY